MAVAGSNTGGPETYYAKGAIDALLERCTRYHVADGSTPPLDASTRSAILTRAQSTAARGLRVVGMAYTVDPPPSSGANSLAASFVAVSRPGTPQPPPPTQEGLRNELVFVGFQAMRDPPRKGVANAVHELQQGGVQVVMITGDAEQTALAIARELGLRVGSSVVAAQQLDELGAPMSPVTPSHQRSASLTTYCLTGAMIDRMNKAQLREAVGSVSVFARTTPRHKMAIVEAFQSRGAVVAMTGDGGMSI
jgi:P-type Ca2+ transporter type 2C